MAELEDLDINKVNELTTSVITSYNNISYRNIWVTLDDSTKESVSFVEFEKILDTLHNTFGKIRNHTLIVEQSDDIVLVINKDKIEANLKQGLYAFYYKADFDKTEGYVEIIILKNNDIYKIRGFRLFNIARMDE